MNIQKLSDEDLRVELSKTPPTTWSKIMKKYGVSKNTVARKVRRLKASGFDPENHRYHKNPSDHPVSGYSTLVRFEPNDPLGRVLEWVKTNRSITDQLDEATQVIAAMTQEIPQVKPMPERVANYDDKKFTVIPLGDPHIGLMTWSKEVGVDWDCKIAQRVFKKVFTRLINRSPDTNEAILVNTGDFFHADNVAGETSRSRHKLDLDGRHGKWLDTGVVLTKMFINICLAKYKKVVFINVPGNHDDILGRALGTFVEHMYETEPRLTVQKGDAPFQYVKRGEVLLGFAHGHMCKLSSLPGKMADDQYKLWGKTTCRHWFTGHVHHNSWLQFKEHPGCTVESVGIIPPKDSYSFGGAYGAKRGTQSVVFDAKCGREYERYQETVLKSD